MKPVHGPSLPFILDCPPYPPNLNNNKKKKNKKEASDFIQLTQRKCMHCVSRIQVCTEQWEQWEVEADS